MSDSTQNRLPRACGDRPVWIDIAIALVVAAPRVRG